MVGKIYLYNIFRIILVFLFSILNKYHYFLTCKTYLIYILLNNTKHKNKNNLGNMFIKNKNNISV